MHKRTFSIFFFLILLSVTGKAATVERDQYNRLVDAVAFKSKISGTSWAYNWNERDFVFGFNPDGKISRLKGWSNVVWTVDQRNEVILSAGDKKMYLFFNDDGNAFKTVDWDRQKATGKFIFNDDK
jgi:hypothetical protein